MNPANVVSMEDARARKHAIASTGRISLSAMIQRTRIAWPEYCEAFFTDVGRFHPSGVGIGYHCETGHGNSQLRLSRPENVAEFVALLIRRAEEAWGAEFISALSHHMEELENAE